MSDEGDKELEERLAEVEAENNAIKEYLGKLVENGPSRRQVLKSGATVAGAGALGFTAGNASAQASENDSDGNVGLSDNRVDVFADGVDSNYTTPDNLTGTYPSKVRAISGGEVVASIDPANSSNPPQDAIDAINNVGDGSGLILLPDGVSTPGGLNGYGYTTIRGYHRGTQINHTDDTQPFAIAKSGDRNCFWTDLDISGPGSGASATSAFQFTEAVPSFDIGHLIFRDYNASSGLIDQTSGSSWVSQWGYIRGEDYTGKILERGASGSPLTEIGMIESYADSDTYIIALNSGAFKIHKINIGRQAGPALYASGYCDVDLINYEITAGSGDTFIARLQGDNYTRVGEIVNNQSITSITACRFGNGPGGKIIQSVSGTSSAIYVADQPASASWYFGPSSEIDGGGFSTGLVRSLASAGTGNG